MKIEAVKQNHLRLILENPKVGVKHSPTSNKTENVEWWAEYGSPRDLDNEDSGTPKLDSSPVLLRSMSEGALPQFGRQGRPLSQQFQKQHNLSLTYSSKLSRLVNLKYKSTPSSPVSTPSSPTNSSLRWSWKKKNTILPIL
jgi:hypothetical protein